MIRLAISVEGETEEEFVNNVLAEHLRRAGVEPEPVLVGGGGGNVTIDGLASDMANLSQSYDCVTSLVDFYGFARRNNATIDQLRRNVNTAINEDIQRRWQRTRQNQRVFTYIQQYEFEGLLFSDVACFAQLIDLPDGSMEQLANIRSQFSTPEEINNSKETAPSKRIMSFVPRYNKRVDGPFLARAIGLAKIREECRRFDRWVTRLESLPATIGDGETP